MLLSSHFSAAEKKEKRRKEISSYIFDSKKKERRKDTIIYSNKSIYKLSYSKNNIQYKLYNRIQTIIYIIKEKIILYILINIQEEQKDLYIYKCDKRYNTK